MDGIRATPYQYPLVGSVNELIGGLLGYMRDPRRTQQMQGLAGLLESTGIPKTVERLAYGEPLTNIQRANVPLLRPETAEALLTVAPVPPIAGRATMAAGRAGERLAERVVPQIMERGGMPAGLLEGMSSRTVSPLTVYHGSPAKFERFDPTKIGSGEGAQAYGYGHYVAESPEVARGYQESLSGGAMKMLRSTFSDDPELWVAGQIYSKISKPDIKEGLQILGYKGNTDELIKSAENRMKNELQAGSFYEIDLPDEQIAKMLDWDKPLSEQPQKIQQAIYNDLTDAGYSKTIVNDLLNRKTGMELYKTLYKGMEQGDEAAINLAKKLNLGEQGMMMEAPALASESLRRMGIPGIRYLDQASRGTGEGTSNFVVFPGNEGLLTIQKRNNEAIAPTGLLDYRIEHRPMTVEGGASRLHDAGAVFGEDVYGKNALQYFGSGLSGEKTSLDILKKVRGNPDAEITIYRGVPEGVNAINKGDWVTLDPKMAEEYGNVISKKVKARDITTWPDSLVEFGYYPD